MDILTMKFTVIAVIWLGLWFVTPEPFPPPLIMPARATNQRVKKR